MDRPKVGGPGRAAGVMCGLLENSSVGGRLGLDVHPGASGEPTAWTRGLATDSTQELVGAEGEIERSATEGGLLGIEGQVEVERGGHPLELA